MYTGGQRLVGVDFILKGCWQGPEEDLYACPRIQTPFTTPLPDGGRSQNVMCPDLPAPGMNEGTASSSAGAN